MQLRLVDYEHGIIGCNQHLTDQVENCPLSVTHLCRAIYAPIARHADLNIIPADYKFTMRQQLLPNHLQPLKCCRASGMLQASTEFCMSVEGSARLLSKQCLQ